MFNPFLLFTLICLIAGSGASFAAPPCEGALTTAADLVPPLNEADRSRIRQISLHAETKMNGLGLPEDRWAIDAFRVYAEARKVSLNLSPQESDFVGSLAVIPGIELTLHGTQDTIILPREFFRTVLSTFIAAHETEHRIQLLQIQRLGLDGIYPSLILATDLHRHEIQAMKAEWEFANSLSPEGCTKLTAILERVAKTQPEVKPMTVVCKTDLRAYLELNQEHGRYSQVDAQKHVAKQIQTSKTKFAKDFQGMLENFTGEWKISKKVVVAPYERYAETIRSVLPQGFSVDINSYSADIVKLSVRYKAH